MSEVDRRVAELRRLLEKAHALAGELAYSRGVSEPVVLAHLAAQVQNAIADADELAIRCKSA